MRLRDLLTGQLLNTFQDLSPEGRISFYTVRDKILASQNLTSERFRKQFQQVKRPPDKNFEYVSHLKTIFHWWLSLSKVSTFEQLSDLVIMNKILESCHPNLCTFLLERDPNSMEEITKRADHYNAANWAKKVKVRAKAHIILPALSAIPTPLNIKLHSGLVEDMRVSVFGVAKYLVSRSANTGRFIKCHSVVLWRNIWSADCMYECHFCSGFAEFFILDHRDHFADQIR